MVPGYDPRSGGVVKKAGPIRCGQARCRRPGVICSPKTGPREMRVLQVNRLFLPVRQTPAGTGTPVRCGVFPYYSVFARISPLLSICQGQEPVLFHAFLAKSSVECVDEGPACGLPAPPKSGFTPPMPSDQSSDQADQDGWATGTPRKEAGVSACRGAGNQGNADRDTRTDQPASAGTWLACFESTGISDSYGVVRGE